MHVKLLWGLAAYYLATGLYITLLPQVFYENAPGVSATGPYNMHFLLDVGFAFTISAIGIGFGLRLKLKPLLVFASAWLVVHGLFHLVLWFLRSEPGALPALIDLVLVVLPAGLLAYLAARYKPA